ncbi:MAG: FKBP-type peptidyl-prolyl cis-trans isomerase [Bacteroidales bacterium]|nr:FKBP-type peptidyl-prolyl cis-trans isomerase [Bacteroidales bacterium]
MNSILKIKALLFLLIIVFSACKPEDATKQPVNNKNRVEDTLIKANRFLLERDKELIDSYVKRRGWKMQTAESGLWYDIYKKTAGQKIKAGDIIKYNYSIELLDGTLCYSSDSTGSAQVKIGQTGKESGLEKGFLMMRTGEKAHFILPPHMAHGLIGDMERIPSRSTIVYDVEVLELIDF